jgi:hypothetical protein
MQMTRSDTIISLSGAAVALAAGLWLGGLMQPHLDEGDGRPSGPQMFADWAGDRSTGPFDPGTTFVNYQGRIPDYVMGTDWKKRMTWPDETAAVSAAPRDEAGHDGTQPREPAATLTHAAYEDAPPPLHDYPSLGGAAQASAASVMDLPPAAYDASAAPTTGG